jgi:segregation and condensation protein B
MTDNTAHKNKFSLSALIEALLFVSSTPISIGQLSTALDESQGSIKFALDELEEKYKQSGVLRIQRKGTKAQLTTAPELSNLIENFLGVETTSTLSQASLETLAIIAFKQPITRPAIEEVRGVNSDGVVRNLLSKGLIEELGRAEGLGRPILYGTSSDFLSHFGLNSLDDLPALELPVLEIDEKIKVLKE